MNLRIVVDTIFRGMYHLKNDKTTIALIQEDINGNREIGFTVVRLKFQDLLEIHEFVTTYDKWLTSDK